MQRGWWCLFLVTALLLFFVQVSASSIETTLPTGLRTERLSPKDQLRWNNIESLIFAQSPDGQWLHPTLINLWQWVETSGHVVYVEFSRSNNILTSTAGQFRIERLDPRGERHIGVISLNLSSIDAAYIGADAQRPLGFIPFDKLKQNERYAEVLGHEMAHAADILTSLDRVAKVEEFVQKTNELLMHHRSLKPTEKITRDLMNRLDRRDELLKTLEAAADRAEAVVWRELVASKVIRERLTARR
ncbi:MAG: hypothetical protein HOP19_00750 [Acidobacteria bacterium]|nr:hypothetical protein [Acidobacteriota bacterium]